MPLIEVELPEQESGRGSTAPTLARNVAALFGVKSNQSAGPWICSLDLITLQELRSGIPTTIDAPSAGISPALAPATLNRFGPDTKAAAVLAGANELLKTVTTDLTAALRALIAANSKVEPAVLLGAWAAGVLTVYRSYPLLINAALRSREVQRASLRSWNVFVPPALQPTLASSEYQAGMNEAPKVDDVYAPRALRVLEHTLVELAPMITADLSADVTSLLDSVAATLARRLLSVGGDEEGDPAVVWASDSVDGGHQVEVLLPQLSFITNFVREQAAAILPARTTTIESDRFVIELPDNSAWEGLRGSARRLLLEIHVLVLRWLREDDMFSAESLVGGAAEEQLNAVRERAELELEPYDYVRLDALVGWQTPVLRRQTDTESGPLDLDGLINSMDLVDRRLNDGMLDTGFGLDLLGRGLSALNRARLNGKGRVPDDLTARIRSYWQTFERLLVTRVAVPQGASAAGYQLHSYAGFLGTLEGDIPALEDSLRLFRLMVIPSRRETTRHGSQTNGFRLSLQVAARAAMFLSDALAARGSPRAAPIAAEGRIWALEAIAEARKNGGPLAPDKPGSDGVIPSSIYLFTLSVARVILTAHERGAEGVEPEDLDVVSLVIERARDWVGQDRTGLRAAKQGIVLTGIQERLVALAAS